MRQQTKIISIIIGLLLGMTVSAGYGQKPYRVGTTIASFLEIGYGSAGSAMGDAYVSLARDLSAQYWNPAGLSFMEQHEAQFLRQPWIADITSTFAGVGLALPEIGTLALGFYHVDFGEQEVTTVLQQEGTGEMFNANDFAVALSYSRRLTHWFAFGATAKYISSQIWHCTATAMAVDLGVVINTQFFSMTGERENGMSIGMSISNYGTRMKYNGIDLVNPIDILPNEKGNYKDTPGQFRLNEWELPLIFRLGVSLQPIVASRSRVIVAADALHPNNNSESMNLGVQYQYKIPGTGAFYLRGGYKALFMNQSEFGPTFGGGMELFMMNNLAVKVDYAYREVGILGQTHSYSVAVRF
ncbi:MAG: PorV/PorQ family protein [candidate division KSB1 bacterium]|nr:PorV/PorQ family protein [candidate division KSB1 bacterium]